MASQIQLGEISVAVTLKNIKNIHLSVHPPTGHVRISAPSHMNLESIRVFAIAKLGWIRQQQKRLREQARETAREFLARESHYVWGKRYLLEIHQTNKAPFVELTHGHMVLYVRPDTDIAKKQAIIDEWYREQLRNSAERLIAKWESRLQLEVERFFVQKMKTKWGSCNPARKTIRLNTELAKKPKSCLEYIVVHEMIHFLEPTHNERFRSLLDRYMPKWTAYRQTLNRLPLRHEHWQY
jgi:predicted metal-dependent hydrolase